MSSDSSNAGSNLVFFLLGATVGAAIALLYAPQEGTETRRLIGEKAGEVKDKASEVTSTVTQTAKDKWGVVTDKAHELLNRGQQMANDAVDQAADSAHSVVTASES